MKRLSHMSWAGILFSALMMLAVTPEAWSQEREELNSEITMPAPRVRRRVPPRNRSRITSLEADRARQAVLHSRPRPTRSYVPKHRRVNAEGPLEPFPQGVTEIIGGQPEYVPQEALGDGAVMYDDEYLSESYAGEYEGPVMDEGWEEGFVGDSCSADGCGGCCDCGDVGYDDLGQYPFGTLWGLGNLEFSLGLQGFVGPFNQGDSGSFGFQQGFNFGTVVPLFPYSGIGWQIGTRTTQSNLSGADFTNEERHQTFFTTGFFRRSDCGWQGGLVVDVLEDKWFAEANVTQLRGEISFKYPSIHEWGYRFVSSTSDDEVASPINSGQFDTFEGHELHSFFYRRRLNWTPGGVTSFFAGFSGESDGYVGADARLPLTDFIALRSSFAYLVPNEPTSNGGTENEAWNLSMLFELNMRGVRPGFPRAQFTPLFDVADNGNFILRRASTR